jgi:hypothetical protein
MIATDCPANSGILGVDVAVGVAVGTAVGDEVGEPVLITETVPVCSFVT